MKHSYAEQHPDVDELINSHSDLVRKIAWQIHDIKGDLIEVKNYIIKPEGFTIPYNSEKIHGISTDLAHKKGLPLKEVLSFFNMYSDSLPLFPTEVKLRHLLIKPTPSDSAKEETINFLKTIKKS